jgi:CyaY protein
MSSTAADGAGQPAGHRADPSASPSGLSDVEYRQRTDHLLSSLEATVDRWLQDDVIDIDSQRTGGLLDLAFPDGSKLIINTQPPLHEVWLAARAGGFHFRFEAGRWLDTRSGAEFHELLSRQASAQGGLPLQFLPAV